MSQPISRASSSHDRRWFAASYNWLAAIGLFRGPMATARRQLAQSARGTVLEIGAGGGQNFAFYDPAVTDQVEAIEPNRYMLARAYRAAKAARVPIHLTRTAAEQLPFADATFDNVLATLVFCSVEDPLASLGEIRRTLKPGGRLLLLEHVRSTRPIWSHLQDWLTPVQQRIAGNCHLNRDTGALVRSLGFTVETEDSLSGGLHPLVMMRARHPTTPTTQQ